MLREFLSPMLVVLMVVPPAACKRNTTANLASSDETPNSYEEVVDAELAKLSKEDRVAYAKVIISEKASVEAMSETDLYNELLKRSFEIYVNRASTLAKMQTKAAGLYIVQMTMMRDRMDRQFPYLKEKMYRNVIGERFVTIDGKRVQNPSYNSIELEQFRDPRYSEDLIKAKMVSMVGMCVLGLVVVGFGSSIVKAGPLTGLATMGTGALLSFTSALTLMKIVGQKVGQILDEEGGGFRSIEDDRSR